MSPTAKEKAAKPAADDDDSLKRLPGTGWQTRDGRFTIATASGTWSVTDDEQTDELGLPLVRGPFRSLTDAKAAIDEARSGAPPKRAHPARAPIPTTPDSTNDDAPPAAAMKARRKPKEAPSEPRWIAELASAERRRAKRLIARLRERDAADAEGIARRDVAGDVPTIARFALAEQLARALDGADRDTLKLAGRLLELLGEGRDDDLDVRWRLVDDQNRPVGVSADDVAAALKRNA